MNRVFLGAVNIKLFCEVKFTLEKLVNGSCNSELASMKKLPPDFNGRAYIEILPLDVSTLNV